MCLLTNKKKKDNNFVDLPFIPIMFMILSIYMLIHTRLTENI